MAKFEFENWNMCNGRRARLLFSSCLFGRQLNMTVANEGKWATTTELKKKNQWYAVVDFAADGVKHAWLDVL